MKDEDLENLVQTRRKLEAAADAELEKPAEEHDPMIVEAAEEFARHWDTEIIEALYLRWKTDRSSGEPGRGSKSDLVDSQRPHGAGPRRRARGRPEEEP